MTPDVDEDLSLIIMAAKNPKLVHLNGLKNVQKT
jgi:hypothetical protein